MKTANRWIGLMGVGVILVGATSVFGQDWPQWRGANRDGKVAGFTAPQTWPQALTQKWKMTVGAGDATPALVGDRLYVFVRQGDEEVTLCLSAADGKELWRDKYAAQAVTGAAARHPGPRSSPAVADGKVVTLGVGGVLSCLDAATGKVVWRNEEFTKAVPQFFTATSPILVDGMCIAHLGGKGKNLNDDIGELVKRGLPMTVKQALDIVRVTGNDAVHPGVIDTDDSGVVGRLFPLVNLIVDYMVSKPKEINKLHQELPEGARKQIAERDGSR